MQQITDSDYSMKAADINSQIVTEQRRRNHDDNVDAGEVDVFRIINAAQ